MAEKHYHSHLIRSYSCTNTILERWLMKITAMLSVIVLCVVLCVVALFALESSGHAPAASAAGVAAPRRPDSESLAVAPGAAPSEKSASQVLFDDFSYSDRQELAAHSWIV